MRELVAVLGSQLHADPKHLVVVELASANVFRVYGEAAELDEVTGRRRGIELWNELG